MAQEIFVPEGRESSLKWLQSLEPHVVADVLDGARLLASQQCDVAHRDLYEEKISEIEFTHRAVIRALRAEHHERETLVIAERNVYKEQLHSFRNKSLSVENDDDIQGVYKDIVNKISDFYAERNRLPKSSTDIFPCAVEVPSVLVAQPTLFDGALKEVKQSHYKQGYRKRVKDEN